MSATDGQSWDDFPAAPLISCVMTTADRPDFLEQAVHYFTRQDYLNKELVIVDTGAIEAGSVVGGIPSVRYLRAPSRLSPAERRDFGCRQARGGILADWGDTAWYGPSRLSAQAAALADCQALLAILSDVTVFDLESSSLWRSSASSDQPPLTDRFDPGTILFRRELWDALGGFRDTLDGEVAGFIRAARQSGAVVTTRPGRGLVVHVQDRRSKQRLPFGGSSAPPGSHSVTESEIPAADRDFYRRQSPRPSPLAFSSRTLGRPDRARVAVGITVHAQPEQLSATLMSLAANTYYPVDLLLLPDGPDEHTMAALASLGHIPQSASIEPRGVAACFNRLISNSSAETLVLLESGSRVAPGWLEHILAALDADPGAGLAGPSTNRCWNEQRVDSLAGARGGSVDLSAAAWKVAERFGPAARPLGDLHSLADFCYVVQRRVVDAIGVADEGYELGPCWEMDYTIRAARAGFRALWACAAFVWRAPPTPRRETEEHLRFEESKRRYQDKFCGLRLTGQTTVYDRHCTGDACRHFAPKQLIQTYLAPGARVDGPPTPNPRPAASLSTPSVPNTEVPLVSCVMPTGSRPGWLRQAIRYFELQDWPHAELIIIDDGGEDLSPEMRAHERVRYWHIHGGLSIGVKRNYACELARGAVIMQWDDDDWYRPDRITRQVEPILSNSADVTAFRAGIFFDVTAWRFWTCSPELHRRMFVHDVHGGTLAFRREIWDAGLRYPDASLAEDAAFLQMAIAHGAKLAALPNVGSHIYVRHDGNAWAFRCGEFLDPAGWAECREPEMPVEDIAFYRQHSASPTTTAAVRSAGPLASCIMPTANRRLFVPHAIAAFLAQDYPDRELVIVDDAAQSIADLVPADPRIRYVQLSAGVTLGAKRNIACTEARGEVILHWDDDDWMAPQRISCQVEQLLRHGAEIAGIDRVLFCGPGPDEAWEYVYPEEEQPWVYGGALCYRKALWERQPFAEVSVGEDNGFVWAAPTGSIARLADNSFYVGMIHGANTSPKLPQGSRWRPWSAQAARRLLGADWERYAALLSAPAIAS